MSQAAPLLAVIDLTITYGGIRAVEQVSLTLQEGELVALIGANGAGKSSTLRAVAGLVPIAAGDVRLAGESLRGVPAHQIPRRGLVLVPEGRRVFGELSVLDNLYLGGYTRTPEEREAGLERVFALFPRLKERARQAAGTLSGGEQQMLAIGRALMANPRVLLLDEPSLGLAPVVVEQVFDLLRRLHAAGVSMLLVEQNARMALAVADRAYVLQTGRIVMAGPAAELAASDAVRARYLGAGRMPVPPGGAATGPDDSA
ncbi:MAG: ABC transporter ATP-binding protein [Sphaerobacter sp.]|nr:ABC transporter ATP-binding protein [Sphaerobacter sp.]